MSDSTSPGPAQATGQFQIANGQILDPSGNVYTARGIDLDPGYMGAASQILADFPGLNFIRLTVYNYDPPATYAAFIQTMTARGIVVELEDHTSSDGADQGGSRGTAFTGARLTSELNWYSSVAKAYAANPYVWFGTDNEPPNAGLTAWQQATYNAVRDTGNTAPIMLELPGGAYPGDQTATSYGLDPNVYAPMTNILMDVHEYGWSSNFVPNQQTVDAALTDLVDGAKTVPSANGQVPVILGEYGISTDGVAIDANANQVVRAAQQSTLTSGAVAFTWAGQGADTLTDGTGKLTEYGQEVAQWIAAQAGLPATPAAASATPATVSQSALSTFAATGAAPSLIGGSQGQGLGSGGTGVSPPSADPTAAAGSAGSLTQGLGSAGLDDAAATPSGGWMNGAPSGETVFSATMPAAAGSTYAPIPMMLTHPALPAS